MNIHITELSDRFPPKTQQTAQDIVRSALSRFEEQVRDVLVRLGEIAPDHGEKHCKLEIRLNRSGTIYADARADDIEAAVHAAVEKAKKQLTSTRRKRSITQRKKTEKLGEAMTALYL